MARNAFGLGFVFTAENRTNQAFNQVDKNYRKLNRGTDKAMKRQQAAQGAVMAGTAAVAASAVILGGAFKAAEASGDFDQAIAKVGAISGATTDEIEKLSAAAIQAGLDTQFSPKEAAEGLGELAVRGLNASESINALDGALNLAAGGQLSISQASSTTASALRVFGLEADQAGIAADKLLKISNVTALQANDLELALGTVGRGAGLAKQSIDEMLPSIGLVKNTGVDASVAASSVSSALIFMAKNGEKFKKLGINVTDADGKFRPFMDIVMDANTELSKITNEAERAAKATELFGRFGVTAFTAISGQLDKGIRTPTGEIVKMDEAVTFLRESMTGAAGTAEKFADALLDTLPGQITLLKGSIQTLAVTVGKPLSEMLRPLVEFIRDTVNRMIEIFNDLPPGFQKAIVAAIAIGGVLLGVGGIILLVGGMIGVALPVIQALVGALASAAPVLAGVAAGAAAVAAILATLRVAFQRNVGGFADRMAAIFGKIKLFFKGLFQLIKDGFISGPTAKALQKPENAGILKFLIVLVKFGFRVKRFFQGLREGFNQVIDASGPVFNAFADALEKIGEAFGGLVDDADGALGPSEKFAKVGAFIGKVVAKVLTIAITIISGVMSAWAGMVKGFRATMKFFQPFFNAIAEAINDIASEIGSLLEELGIMDSNVGTNMDIWEAFGMVLGFFRAAVLGPLIVGITSVVRIIKFWVKVIVAAVRLVMNIFGGFAKFWEGFGKLLNGDILGAFESFGEGLDKIFGGIGDFFKDIFDAVAEHINGLLDLLADVAARLPEAVRPEFLDDFVESRRGSLSSMSAEIIANADAEFERQMQLDDSFRRTGPIIPYANNIQGAAEKTAAADPMTKDEMAEAVAAGLREGQSGKDAVINVKNKVILDGEEQASATMKSNALGFGGAAAPED